MKKTFFMLMILISLQTIQSVAPGYAGTESKLSSERATVSETRINKVRNLSSLGKLFIKSFVFHGNTVFSSDELSGVIQGFKGREITFEELEQARRQLTEYYTNNGYINSGAVIPDQKVSEGFVEIHIKEGHLSQIRIDGNHRLRSRYVSSRLEQAVKGGRVPLNYKAVLERLRLLKEDLHIDNIHARIKPGLGLGEAELEVTVEEANPWQASIELDNHRSPGIGSYRGLTQVSHNNLSGWGDMLRLQYGITEGLDEYQGQYSLPVTRWDTILTCNAEQSDSIVVSAPFDNLNITSRSTRFGVTVRQPFYRSASHHLIAELELEKTRNQSKLDGEPFPFSPYQGEDRGIYRGTVLRFHQEYVNRGMTYVAALRSTFSTGLDMWNSTIDVDEKLFGPDAANANFFKWLGQAQLFLQVRRVLNSQVRLRLNGQLTSDSLLPSEQYGIGGHATVRGYRENLLTADNGMNASLEWHVPILQWPVLLWGKKFMVDGILFSDWARAWNAKGTDPDLNYIASVGMGLHVQLGRTLSVELFFGKALKDIPASLEYDIQDDGIHFLIRAKL